MKIVFNSLSVFKYLKLKTTFSYPFKKQKLSTKCYYILNFSFKILIELV